MPRGARERLERLAARVLVGSDREFILIPKAWIDGESRESRLTRAGRDVDVHVLERKKQLYADAQYTRVDAAIELLEPLATGSPATAVASGWAAFEHCSVSQGTTRSWPTAWGRSLRARFRGRNLQLFLIKMAKSDASLAAAAYERMKKLLADPHAVMKDIETPEAYAEVVVSGGPGRIIPNLHCQVD